MRDGLEEFLKRIEAKPTNEMLIDRFMTLMLEEDAFNRIYYLKKLTSLLLGPNPYFALKAAALELQEARKEKMNKEYELGALKDVESCFLKLGKDENAQLIREEINKLTLDSPKVQASSQQAELPFPTSIPAPILRTATPGKIKLQAPQDDGDAEAPIEFALSVPTESHVNPRANSGNTVKSQRPTPLLSDEDLDPRGPTAYKPQIPIATKPESKTLMYEAAQGTLPPKKTEYLPPLKLSLPLTMDEGFGGGAFEADDFLLPIKPAREFDLDQDEDTKVLPPEEGPPGVPILDLRTTPPGKGVRAQFPVPIPRQPSEIRGADMQARLAELWATDDKAEGVRLTEAKQLGKNAAEARDMEKPDAEARGAELRLVEDRAAEKRAAAAKAAESRMAEARAAEKHVAEVREAEMRAAEAKAHEMRMAELRANEMRAAEIRIAEAREAERRAAEMHAAEMRAAEAHEAEMRAAIEAREIERRAAEQRAAELRAAESRAAEMRAAEQRAAEQQAAEMRAAESRAAEMRAAESRAAEMRAAESRAAEMRAAESRAAEMRAAESRAAEMRAAEAREVERRTAEAREAERLASERQAAEAREAQQRAAEAREAERLASERQSVESREAQQRAAEVQQAEARELEKRARELQAVQQRAAEKFAALDEDKPALNQRVVYQANPFALEDGEAFELDATQVAENGPSQKVNATQIQVNPGLRQTLGTKTKISQISAVVSFERRQGGLPPPPFKPENFPEKNTRAPLLEAKGAADKVTYPNWEQLRERLRQLSGTQINATVSMDFVRRLLGKNASADTLSYSMALVLQFVNGENSARIRQNMGIWFFELLDPIAMHQLWQTLHMRPASAQFFQTYVMERLEAQEYRRALNVMRAVLVPELELDWYKLSYPLLQDIWDRLGLKGWVWSEAEGAEAFCKHLSKREALLPMAILA